MALETPGGIKAMEELERVAKLAGYPAEDPGLRDRFTELPRASISLICCGLDKGINHGNLLRLADCFRLEEVCFSPVGRRKEKDFSGGFAALKWQPFRWVEPEEAIAQAKREGKRVYGLTLTEGATPLERVRWKIPAAIVLGRELEGLDEHIHALCDEFVAIPLYGMIQSMNVAMAAALAVSGAFEAFNSANPGFEPARELSKRLLKPEAPG